MKRTWILFFSVVMCILFQARSILAEPWLAQRYAQNCTACHAPGRVNKAFADKRFSLSCESCHENPNGGGLRNHYGKWTQERWLRSHLVNFWISGQKPSAPMSEQQYAVHYPPVVNSNKTSEAPKVNSTVKGSTTAEGAHYSEVIAEKVETVDESKYSPLEDKAHLITAKKEEAFELYVPDGDPYWKEKNRRIQIGGDLRYYIINSKVESQSDSNSFLQADAGLSYKILNRPNTKLVFEYRYLSDPMAAGALDEDEANDGVIRSAYLKIDDMAYNTYLMAGIYRPMFGLYNANPFSLREGMVFLSANGAQQAAYDGVTYGGSPGGIPFFNISLLTGAMGAEDESKGYVFNFGGRFTTYGLNFMASFWNTEKDMGQNKLTKQMLSISGGFNMDNQWIGNLETIFFKEDTNPAFPVRNSGYISTVDLKRRLWREYYLNANVSWANTARDFSEGSVMEYGLGVKGYLMANFEMSLLYTQGSEKRMDLLTMATTTDYNYFLFQTHLFW